MLRRARALVPLVARLEAQAACGAQASASCREMSTNYYDAPNGPAVKQVAIEDEWYNRQRNLFPILREHPYYPLDVYIAPNAVVCGDVDLYGKSAIFFGAVVRGDLNKIRIGHASVVLDRAVIHAARNNATGLNAATIIGDKVLIEPCAVLRSCRVEPVSIVGARSVVCEGSIIETEAILAPGSVVPPGRIVPSGQLWAGNPAKFVRKLTDGERSKIEETVQHYTNMATILRQETFDSGNAWRSVEAYRAKLVQNGDYEWVNFREQKYMMRLAYEAESMAKLVQY